MSKKIPIALQLWSVRNDTARDFAATVGDVARMGYAGVEIAGFGNTDAKGAKAALDAAGLKVAGIHAGITQLRADLNQCIDEALLLGTRHMTCPWWPPGHYHSGAACTRLGEELGALGATFRSHGIQFAFHNHASELAIVDGRRVLDWMLDAAAPRDLGCQADVYWIQVGGKNPADFIREQGRRIRTVHLKDEKEIGTGPVNFEEVFTAVETIGAVEWYIVEVEQYNHAPLESVRLSLEQLKKWKKA
ncbi:MAG: xylose isomerase [Verrucomicrobia bacterium]|nr:xylose isomerase [Verrucomicrobiota bacterium]